MGEWGFSLFLKGCGGGGGGGGGAGRDMLQANIKFRLKFLTTGII